MFLFFHFSGNTYSQIDTIDPQLISFTILPQSVDITTSTAAVTITCIVTDNISGVGVVSPSMFLPDGTSYSGGASMIAGDSSNGTWAKTFTIPVGTEGGTGYVYSLYISDRNGNNFILDFDDLEALGYDADFEVVNISNLDVTPPQLLSLVVSPQSVNITSQSATITVTSHVTDDYTGTSTVTPTMILPNGNQSTGGSNLSQGTILDGYWVKTFNVPAATEPGTAIISSVYLSDLNGNNTVLDSNELMDLGFDIHFEIINDNPPDVTPPVLIGFTVTPQIVNLYNGAVNLDITGVVTDDISGVSTISPLMFLPNGIGYSGGASLIEGTNLNGTWRKTFTIPYGTQMGIGYISTLYVSDLNANNYTLTFNQLFNMGFDPDYLIVYEILPVDLISFHASLVKGETVLTWQTASEQNNSGFEIQVSYDKFVWERLSFIQGHVFSHEINNYSFTHPFPKKGMNYYRLKQLDLDGNSKYSPTANVFILNDEIEIHPNPTDGFLEINAPNGTPFTISDYLGRIILDDKLTSRQINMSSAPPGLYFVNIYSETGVIVKKILKTL